MKKRFVLYFSLLAVLLVNPAYAKEVYNQSNFVEFLFVQSAMQGSYDGTQLTLKQTPDTFYFSERPSRIYGHLTNQKFVEQFNANQPNSFRNDPPNAILSFSGTEAIAEVVLEEVASFTDSEIVYKVSVVTGTVPKTFTKSTLFIDGGYPYWGN